MSVPRLLAAVAAIVAVVVAALVVRAGGGSPTARSAPAVGSAVPARHTSGSSPHRSAERRALRVLHTWDARRAEAYRTGSGRRLRSLYAAGSSAGRADLRLLAGYRSRGFTVAGMRTQVLALEVRTNRRHALEVRVDDRVVGAVAVRGSRRVRLPRDAASTRVVAFVRSGGWWRVSEVRDARARGPG